MTRILVVDDDAILRTELTELLRGEGADAVPAGSGKEAVERLAGERFHLVLTDLKMKPMDGLELLAWVKENAPGTDVALITAYASVDSAVKAMKNGALDYIEKPFRIEEIRALVANIERRQALIGRRTAPEWLGPAPREQDVFSLFAGAISSGGKGLCISPVPEEELLKRYPLAGTEFILLKQDSGLHYLREAMLGFAVLHPAATVLFHGVEVIARAHRPDTLLTFFSKLWAELKQGDNRLIVHCNPDAVDPALITGLRQLFGRAYVEAISESLLNPIRAAIIRHLFESGRATFSAILGRVAPHHSPKLSFHMRRLVEEGMVAHDGREYRLTRMGELGVELLTMMEGKSLDGVQEKVCLAFSGGKGS